LLGGSLCVTGHEHHELISRGILSSLHEIDGDNPRLGFLQGSKEVFAKWESHLRALYCKPSSLAMFLGQVNVEKGIHEASAQLQGQQRGRQNQAAFTPEALPSDDFQSQVRQPLWPLALALALCHWWL